MSVETIAKRVRSPERIGEQLDASMDRRAVLRTLLATGFGVGVARGALDVESFLSAPSGDVSVVVGYARSRDDEEYEARTTTVPARWYAAVERAFAIQDVFASDPLAGYLGSAVEPGPFEAGTASITVDVSVDDATATLGRLGDVLGQVDLGGDVRSTVRRIDPSLVTELEDDAPKRSTPVRATRTRQDGRVPGGVVCHGSFGRATLAPGLYHPDRGRLLATAAHAFDPNEASNSRTIELPIQKGESITVGTDVRTYREVDVATARPVEGIRPESAIQGATPERIVGQFTKFGLATLIARNAELEKAGSITGRTSGRLAGIGAASCIGTRRCLREQLRWGEERDFTDGDSGGVLTHPDPEKPESGRLVAGFTNGRTWWPGQNFVWGTAAYHLTDVHGYHF